MVKIIYYGHACFALDDGSTKIIIDPYLTGNPLAAISADQVEADYILVTHGHGDHAGDAAAIAKRTGAAIITSVDVGEGLFGDYENKILGNIGGTIPLPFGSVQLVTAIHGSGVPGALACGFIVKMDGRKIYHMGDTALTKDFELYDGEIDVLLAPIGDFFTMGPDDAVRAAMMMHPECVIPMHYNTFPPICQDPEAFAAACVSEGINAKVIAPGESCEF